MAMLGTTVMPRSRVRRAEPSYPISSWVLKGDGGAGPHSGVLGDSKSQGGDGHPKVPTFLCPTLKELKHKILLKGKKIGRLEDTLDGPGDEAPDVSDDDNGAEAEEERRRAKVGGLSWGPAINTESPTDTAMGHGDIPVPRGGADTVGTAPDWGGSPFCPWPCQLPLCTVSLLWHHAAGPLPAPFLAGRLPVAGMLPPPAPHGCSGLSWALQPLRVLGNISPTRRDLTQPCLAEGQGEPGTGIV